MDATSVDIDDQGPIQFSLWISFAEIYNEYIYDLLEPISMNKETRKRTALRVGDDRKGNPYIKGTYYVIFNTQDGAFYHVYYDVYNERRYSHFRHDKMQVPVF